MNIHQLAPEEPLSPELVLVLPTELRAQVLATLAPPLRPRPRKPVRKDAAVLDEPIMRSLGALLATRVVTLGLIFLVVTIATLAMSLVAHAVQ